MSRFSVTGYKLFIALLITLAVMTTPVVKELKYPAPRQDVVAIGWPWVWFVRVAPEIVPCTGTAYGQVQPRICTTPEEYGEYSVEPGALVATVALYFIGALLLLVLASPKSRQRKETGNTAESDDANM